MKLINIGFGNMVSASRLIAIVSPESAPIKRMVQEARDRGVLVDATYGRRTRAVLITDSDHIILSALQPETVAGRLNGREELAGGGRGMNERDLGGDLRLFRRGQGHGLVPSAGTRVLISISPCPLPPVPPEKGKKTGSITILSPDRRFRSGLNGENF